VRAIVQSFLRLKSRPFVRSVIAVSGGTAIAQAITIAFTPLVARLYGPEAYGAHNILLSIASIITTFAALSYPAAITLARDPHEAKRLVALSLSISVVILTTIAIGLILWGAPLLEILSAQVVADFSLLIPLAAFAYVLSQLMRNWLIRNSEFRKLALYAILSSALLSGLRAGVGFLNPTAINLVLINIGATIGSTALVYSWRKRKNAYPAKPRRDKKSATHQPKRLIEAANQYKAFAIWQTPQELVNSFSQTLPLLFLSAYVGPSSAGHYGMAITLLGVPAAVLGNSVYSVFNPRIISAIAKGEDAQSLISKATISMAWIALLPFLAIMLLAPQAFPLILGLEWLVAGLYAQILSPLLLLQVLCRPSLASIAKLNLQRQLFIFDLLSTGAKLVSIASGLWLLDSDKTALALYSAAGTLFYAWIIIWVQLKARELKQDREQRS
jgi:O-antigen/teichoic acid export membrane protein